MPSPTSSDSQVDWSTTVGSDESPQSENRPEGAASLPVRHRTHIRQPHKKSRLGCQNCKRRRVKCDELKPGCRKCRAYGVYCTYDKNAGAGQLKPSRESISSQISLLVSACSTNQTLASMINQSLNREINGIDEFSDGSFAFGTFDLSALQMLHRFQNVTVQTVCGTERIAQVYETEIVKLACLHPYLMHAVMTVTAMHDRHVNSTSPVPTTTELYHWQRTSSLFNRKIAAPIQHEDKDALFATSTMLNEISFAAISTTNPHESWPLTSSHDTLQWLLLQQGIRLMIGVAQPWRPESAFHDLAYEANDQRGTYTDFRPGNTGVPQPFIDLCDISPTSTVDNNPYHAAVRMLTPLFELQWSSDSLMKHLNFVGFMQPVFIGLLQQRDARALLLMGIWYGLICKANHWNQWWLARRAIVECTAICMYLDSHADETVRPFLHFPQQACGYSPNKREEHQPQPLLYPQSCVPM